MAGAGKHHWLNMLIPSFRRVKASLKDQNETLRRQIAKQEEMNNDRQEEIFRRDQIIEELRQMVAKKQKLIEKLEKRLETNQVEKEEVYSQYNRLLTGFSQTQSVTDEFSGIESTQEGQSKPVETRGWHLNIGCGRVKKTGYLNVDFDASVSPDVVFSLDEPLPFGSNLFELIEAYHVIEHIYPWATLDTLKELWRILRPQGKLAIECPNIEFACSSLARSSDYGWNSQLGMWAIYGDPNSRNSLHMHKWGYTPLTLSSMLQKAGFVRIQRETPETHIPARDFRIVAIKPEDKNS
jgi:predicted SAM-dependent methyltransferase